MRCFVAVLALSLTACSQPEYVETAAETEEFPAAPEDVNYARDIRPIVEARCQGCHQAGGIAPFTLGSYAEAFAMRGAIAHAVSSRTMPPYDARADCRDYKGDLSLTPEQIGLVRGWVDKGGPAGDLDSPPAPNGLRTDELRLSRVDVRLQPSAPYTPKGEDDYRCFLMDLPLTNTRFITGFRAVPGDARQVHHVVAFLVPPEKVAEYDQRDADDEGEGYGCFGAPGGARDQTVTMLGAWAPGTQGQDLAPGTGIKVVPGTRVAMQVHYNTSAASGADQTALELRLDDSVEQQAALRSFTNLSWPLLSSMNIPAGQKQVVFSHSGDPTNGRPMRIHTAAVHMHRLGKKGRLTVLRASGDPECVLDLRKYDFDWQRGYELSEPVIINPGDQLKLECVFDNSEENQPVVDGVRQPPRDVNWGEGSSDEMCVGFVYAANL